MSFLAVRVSSFRNLVSAEIDVQAPRVFLVGENGQGKTNLLEALYYLCYGASFRGPVDAQAPAKGSEGFALSGTWAQDSTDPPETISVRLTGKTKEIRRNDKILRDRKELVAHNPAVVFCHEDFGFAAGDPEKRRFFFDQCAGMLSVSYIDSLRAYKRVLKQRNAAIRDANIDLLELLDLQFARAGMEIMRDRQALRAALAPAFPDMYEEVSRLGHAVEVEYRPSWPVDADLAAILALLETKRAGEIAFGTSLSGPHRDRWLFRAEHSDFAATASTGQLRLVSLVLRAAQAFLYARRRGRWPVLLLDDVLLELDVGKRRRFLGLLPDSQAGSQAVFTFLPEEPWQEYADASTLVYKVQHGRFSH